MLLVVTCKPSRLTFTGGVEPLLDAIDRFRTGADAVPLALTRLGRARVCKTWVNVPRALLGNVRTEAFRMPTTLARRLFRLVLRVERSCGVAPSVLSTSVTTLPRRSPLPDWAFAFTWIWLVCKTRPSKFTLMG